MDDYDYQYLALPAELSIDRNSSAHSIYNYRAIAIYAWHLWWTHILREPADWQSIFDGVNISHMYGASCMHDINCDLLNMPTHASLCMSDVVYGIKHLSFKADIPFLCR